jgi:hypothetical protein
VGAPTEGDGAAERELEDVLDHALLNQECQRGASDRVQRHRRNAKLATALAATTPPPPPVARRGAKEEPATASGTGPPWLGAARRRGGRRGVGFGCVEVPSRGSSIFEEQDASWGEGEREYGKEERGGEGEGCWEGGRGGWRSRPGV